MGYLADESALRLLHAIEAYDSNGETYDEVFEEVHLRITESGNAGKLDVGALILEEDLS